ncbi:PD-(D/E)XK nuclease family protein [Paludicola sp. MB14-C6]|uniref:PD-(D/E)XK nuclease family protein n=1 Tax=Paludihabitans sp. MB14-C6 TaxID=3070656 RepID=UPI0027DC74E8|nr:PD-(D/E)XK nuclease family protein [Paludicola sp. MB14-C6]WMJ22625.1 PD-(D/E)XK nuclease family protein [Paludicola sp. MB14-C6]
MLQFILGASGTGKTTLVHEMIQQLSENEKNKIMLIVPEQFTYETEKSLFQRLGPNQFMRVHVTSFTRFASEVFKLYGGCAGEYASDPAKTILMDIAINEVKDELEIYQKAARSKTFANTMIDTVTELKNAGVTPNTLVDTSKQLESNHLSQKAKEIALLYSAYDALLYTTYLDPLDDITRATKKLQGTNFFDGYTVFFDEFKGFTANEYDLIKMIFATAKNTYVSLCLELIRANDSDISVFQSVKETYEKLKRFCSEGNVTIKPSIQMQEQKRFQNEVLTHLEQNLFSPVIHQYNGTENAIQATLCKNEYDEVDYTIASIAELVQEKGYRYNDIVIISRDLEGYMSILQVALGKAQIPYYTDSLSKITTKPLTRFVANAFSCIVNHYKSEDILSLLKCGLTEYSVEEIAELENYIYVWGIKGKQWFAPFTANPRGYKESFLDEDTECLERVNKLREFVIGHITKLEQATKHATGKQISMALIAFLLDMKVKENTERLITSLSLQENLAEEYARIWDILMELINTMAVTIAETIVTPKRYEQLYSLLCESYNLGSLPQSLDCVIIGSADRIRITDKKAVFVLGVNENVFPLVPSTGGVFTDKEREQLIALSIEIAPPAKKRVLEERFIAYKTLTSPTKVLYLTARKSDIAGKSMTPSVIFTQLKKMFQEELIQDTEDFNGLFYCKSKWDAFGYLAKNISEDTELTASIAEVLKKDELYAQKLDSLDKVYEKKPYRITNHKNAKELFGEKMSISPTRVEGFYQCKFKYFCEHGLRIQPLRKAELNPMETGTLIHSVLYNITKQVDLKEHFDEKQIKKMIKEELDLYIEQVMGGADDKSKRFIYLYNRMRLSIFKIIERLHLELVQSRFSPCDFEYEITNESDITPLELVSQDGTRISVAGKIDRIDSYINKKGEKYIRIIDYKSGKKVFKLNDVLFGLNFQMLIYLFCIYQNGKGKYENSLPAGILYMPASEQTPSLARDATEVDTEKAQLEHYRMNGLLLQDEEVLNAMEEDYKGVFIPVSTKKDGSFTTASFNALVTLKELGNVNKYISKLITNMADELHLGNIEAVPIENTCDYCNYSGVCGVRPSDAKREYIKYDRQAVLDQMQKQAGEGEQDE